MSSSALQMFLFSLQSVLYVITPMLGNKIISLGPVAIMGGSIVMVLAAGVIDVINSVWGAKTARSAVMQALIMRLIVWGIVAIILALPTRHAEPGFENMMKNSFRLLIAGELAQFLGQYFVDIAVFDWLKKRHKLFWVSYTLSNVFGFAVASVTFTILALAGTGKPMWEVMFGAILWRFVLSVLLTPVFALMSRYASKVAVVAAALLLAFSASAMDIVKDELTIQNSLKVEMGVGQNAARIENVGIITWEPQKLWLFDLLTWDRAGLTYKTAPNGTVTEIPQNSVNNKMMLGYTPFYGFGASATWQVMTGQEDVWRIGVQHRDTFKFFGIVLTNATAFQYAITGNYNFRVDEILVTFWRIPETQMGPLLTEVFTYDFGGPNGFVVNSKMTYGFQVFEHLAVVGQWQVITGKPVMWFWGIQGNL